MAIHYRTKAFVLEKFDLGEADQIFTIFTEDFGKLKVVGKAIRKIKSKLRAGIGLFYLSEIEFIRGKTRKTLTDAEVVEKFKNLKESPDKLEIIQKISEITASLIKGQEKDNKIWDLLKEAFEKTSRCFFDSNKCLLVYYYFLWNLLSILGYQIDLYFCLKCQKKLRPGNLFFNPKKGGIICCGDNSGSVEPQEEKIKISPETVKILRLFLKRDWNILFRLKIEEKNKQELEKISDCFLDKIII